MPHLATLAYTAPYGNRQYVRQVNVLPTASTRVQTDNQYPSDSLTCDNATNTNVVPLASSKHYSSNPRPNPTNVTPVGGHNMVQFRVHVASRVSVNSHAIQLPTGAIHTETGPATIKTFTVLPNTDNPIPGGTWWFRCYTRQPFHLDRTPLQFTRIPPRYAHTATHTWTCGQHSYCGSSDARQVARNTRPHNSVPTRNSVYCGGVTYLKHPEGASARGRIPETQISAWSNPTHGTRSRR